MQKEEPFADEIKDEEVRIRENLKEFLKGKVIADTQISFTDTHEIEAIILKFVDESGARFTRYGVEIKEKFEDLSDFQNK